MTHIRLAAKNGASPRQLAIFLHGVGSNSSSMLPIAEQLRAALPHTAFVLPQAPKPFDAGPSGYQWFTIRGVTEENRGARIAAALAPLKAMVDHELAHHNLTFRQLVLGGFSQGAMMALAMTAAGHQPKALASFAGRLSQAVNTPNEAKTRIFMTHGAMDQVVPLACMWDAQAVLEGAGYSVEAISIPALGHQVSEMQVAALARFLIEMPANEIEFPAI
jgi:phospholipase/carboxylesterase